MTRLFITSLFFFALLGTAFGQVSQGFSYQAVARTAAGECISDGMISIQITVLDQSATGTVLYRERHDNIMTNGQGLFSLTLGEGLELAGDSLNSIDWLSGPKWLEVGMDTTNGSNFVSVGSQQLMAVPFAKVAEESNRAGHAMTAEMAQMASFSDTASYAWEAGNADSATFATSSASAITAMNASNAVNADTATYALTAGNGLQVSANGDEFLLWKGANGLRNGELGGTGTGFNNGILRLRDDTEDVIATLVASSLSGGEDFGQLTLNGDNGNANFVLGTFTSNGANRGAMTMRDENGSTRLQAYINGSNVGIVDARGGNSQKNVEIGNDGTADYGRVSLYDNGGNQRIKLWSENGWGGAGRIATYGPNGLRNIELSIQSDASTNGQNRGALRVSDAAGLQKGYFGVSGNDLGYVDLRGANGNLNVLIANNSASTQNAFEYGLVSVHDDAGGTQASMEVYYLPPSLPNVPFGPRGRVTADVKNFVMDHPTRPNKEIVYSCIEGPEVAAYERGTGQLVNGEALITFSETFEIVANPQTMTVILTPRSPDAKGLAAFAYTPTGFKVKELFQGTGNYAFDWEVKAVRKGWETFPVIWDKKEENPGLGNAE